MHILLTTDFKPMLGGIAEFMYRRCLCPPEDGISVVAPDVEGASAWDAKAPFSVIRYPQVTRVPLIKRLSQFFRMRWGITEVEKRYGKISVVESSMPLPGGLVSALMKKKHGFRTAVFCHGEQYLQVQNIPGAFLLYKKAMNSADLIIANSSFTADMLRKNGWNTVVIHPGYRREIFHPGIDPGPAMEKYALRKPVLYTHARLAFHKGVDTVLKALPKILKAAPETTYVVSGTGPMRQEWEALAASLNVASSVRFLGFVPEEILPSLYAACEVFVAPTKYLPRQGGVEGYGITAAEAAACGKPVIGTRYGGHVDIVEHGVAGLLVDPESVDEVADAVIRLLNNPAVARSMGEKAAEKMQKEEMPNFKPLNDLGKA